MLTFLGAVGMVLWSRHSDRTRERVWHVAAPSILGAVGFILSTYFTSPILGMVSLSIAALGIYAAAPVFWTLSTAFLSGASAAGGIALINSLGNFGGYAGPQLLGFVKDQTQSFAVALLTLAALMAFAGIAALSLGHNADLEECPRRGFGRAVYQSPPARQSPAARQPAKMIFKNRLSREGGARRGEGHVRVPGPAR
jgi:MFS family permease